MSTVPVCSYCGDGNGNIKNISTTDTPLFVHVPPCPSQLNMDRQAQEAARDMSRNGDVKRRDRW
jgi:hypothetical protein